MNLSLLLYLSALKAVVAFSPPRVASRSSLMILRGEVKPKSGEDSSNESASVPVQLDLDFLNDDGDKPFAEAGGDPNAIREAVRQKAAILEQTVWKEYSRDEDTDLKPADIDKLPFLQQLSTEFSMVKWPDQKQVVRTTITVLSLTVFMLLYFAAMRLGTRYVTERIFGEFHDLDML